MQLSLQLQLRRKGQVLQNGQEALAVTIKARAGTLVAAEDRQTKPHCNSQNLFLKTRLCTM
jgi:hypothetical protein